MKKMPKPRPLNKSLYMQLQQYFGRVRISSEGESMMYRYRRRPGFDEPRLDVEHAGEYYQVCCDRCNDTRFRLYINHRWGLRDDYGRRNLWMAICYNENCYADHDQRELLFEKLNRVDGVLTRARILPGVEVDPRARVVTMPGPCVSLDQLPADHPANRYLASRGLRPELLGRFYNVSYCTDSMYYLAINRIIAPYLQDGKLVGWQGRYIGDINWKDKHAPPKWWNDPRMQKSKTLYNIDNAKRYKSGVGMEGPMDVWAFGPQGLATAGASMSKIQMDLVLRHFREYSFVLMYDPDIQHDPAKKIKYDTLVASLDGKFAGGFASILLPDDVRGPGSLSREYLQRYVYQKARKAGVRFSFDLR
jgi:hypothetical protein